MKILVLAPHPFYQNRGTPIALRMLLECLAADGHELTALVYPEGEPVVIPGCRLLRVKKVAFTAGVRPGFSWKKLALDLAMMKMARRLLSSESFDLIHAGEEAVFMARRLQKKFKIPYVYDMDSSLPQQLCEKSSILTPLLPVFRTLERRAVANSTGVLPVCPYLEKLARSYSSGPIIQCLEDITLLPGELDNHRKKKTLLRLKQDNIVLMYVGNLEKYQGIDLLLEAFSLCYLENNRLKLVVIGGNKNDISHYKHKATLLGVDSGVIFTGPKPVEDLAYYLDQAHIVVSPRCKGYNTPMKIYSYLDSGKPVVATRLETHTQVLDDSISMLVAPTDTEMAAGIMRLVNDRELGSRLAARAKQRVSEEYTRTAFNRKLKSFYARIEHTITTA